MDLISGKLSFSRQMFLDWYQWNITWRSVPKARLLFEMDLADWGGSQLFIEDIDGDGNLELLWLQSPGMFKSQLYAGQGSIGAYLQQCPADQFCLTATTLSGAIIWQIGKPYQGDVPYLSHSAENMLKCVDLDNDGCKEILVLDNESHLLVLEGKTGNVKSRVLLPHDNYAQVFYGGCSSNSRDLTILVGVMDRSYSPHSYANPWLFFNSSLELVCERDCLGAGHSVVVADFDGDNRDEFLIGYQLVDSSGGIVWTVDDWLGKEIDALEQHVDHIVLAQLDGEYVAAIAGSDQLYFVDHEGHVLWKKKLPHPQYCLVGYENRAMRIFVFNQRLGMNCFDTSGMEVWSGLLPESWPKGRPSLAMRPRPIHTSAVANLIEISHLIGSDWILYKEGGWPAIFSFSGEPVCRLPFTASVQKDPPPIPFYRINDIGLSFKGHLYNPLGTEIPIVLIHNRNHLWAYDLRPVIDRTLALKGNL